MDSEIILTPSGRLLLPDGFDRDRRDSGGWAAKVAGAFAAGQAAGLFALAASRADLPLPSTFSFWNSFASLYLTALCRTPETSPGRLDPIETPDPGEWTPLLLGAPPMRGGEYLSFDLLDRLWSELDSWVRGEVSSSGLGLSAWLETRAPIWHHVGRVCFHLAENPRDPELPFAFLATYAPGLSRGGRVQYQPLRRALLEYAGARNKKALIKLLSPVHRASEKSGFVKELVDSGDLYHPLAWTPGEAYRLLRDVPILEECGLLVRLPDWWRRRPRPQVSVTIGQRKRSRLGADAMLDFKVGVALDGQELTEEEWRRVIDSTGGLVQMRGRWIEVDPEKLSEALAHWKKVEARAASDGLSFIEGMRLLAGATADLRADETTEETDRQWALVGAGKWLSDLLAGLRDPSGLSGAGGARNLRGSLRPYQETGHKWLWHLTSLRLGACLADDMGLGKTIQVLSLLLAIKDSGKPPAKPSLIVLPASLLANWKSEIARFAPTLVSLFVHPSEGYRNGPAATGGNPAPVEAGVDVVVTTYGMLLRQKWLLDVEWRLVVLDEAQAIKNPSARQSRTVKKLNSEARIALTGTPIENRLSDLWSLFDFLCPGLLGSADRFKRFVKSLEGRPHDRYAPLRNLVQPYVLRRLKTDKRIIADLPDKTEVKAFCGLGKRQAALYARSVEELARALEATEGIKRRGLVLAYLMRFKQICNHPSHFLGDGEYQAGESGKFERLRTLCEEIGSRQEKTLVFTQFREMTDPLASHLAEVFGREGVVLHGGTPVGKRKALIDAFQREEGPPFFVLSLKAGGTGLNLTAASHVIHFDRWWNPAVENQATDRAFRIGQHRNVMVHKFICRGTVEERIDEMIEEKASLAEDILKGGAEAILTEMSDEQLLEIVALDIDRASA